MSHQLIPITNAPQRLTFGVQVAFAIISSVAVTLRITARKRQHIDIQWDDYLIVIALVSDSEGAPTDKSNADLRYRFSRSA